MTDLFDETESDDDVTVAAIWLIKRHTLGVASLQLWRGQNWVTKVKVKGKGQYSSSWELHLRATGRHLPYGITQCYLPPDVSERTPPNPSHAGWYSIYLPQRDGRLSWPSWLDNIPTGSRTSDRSITSPTPNRCTTKTKVRCVLCRVALQIPC